MCSKHIILTNVSQQDQTTDIYARFYICIVHVHFLNVSGPLMCSYNVKPGKNVNFNPLIVGYETLL
jgi:hypothetical protein